MKLNAAHVVCKECGTRWEVTYQEGNTAMTPRECKNRECDAGWLDLPMFMDEADADRYAAEREREVAAMREP
jgi:DNA replicative helicase MCM subunit Mcm2 (Cdc46/Mcm family)